MSAKGMGRLLQDVLQAQTGDTVTLPREVVVMLARRYAWRSQPHANTGKSQRIRDFMGLGVWHYCEDVSQAIGESAFHALKQMVGRESAERQTGPDGRMQYRLIRIPQQRRLGRPIHPAAEGFTEEQWAAMTAKQRAHYRARQRAIAAGTHTPRKVYATEAEREAARVAYEARRLEQRRAERAARRAEKPAKVPRIPKPRQVKPEQVTVKRSKLDNVAIFAPVKDRKQHGGGKVDLAVKPELPSSDEFIAANRDRYEVLPSFGPARNAAARDASSDWAGGRRRA